MSASNKKFIDLKNVRTEEQLQVMEKILSEGHCPFCLENLRLYHKEPILKSGKYWIFTKNQWPYKHTKSHFLIIYKVHAENLSDLPDEAFEELGELSKWGQKNFSILGGALALRFGDTSYSAGSVQHIHAQLIEPDVSDRDYEPVRFKIGAEPKDL